MQHARQIVHLITLRIIQVTVPVIIRGIIMGMVASLDAMETIQLSTVVNALIRIIQVSIQLTMLVDVYSAGAKIRLLNRGSLKGLKGCIQI